MTQSPRRTGHLADYDEARVLLQMSEKEEWNEPHCGGNSGEKMITDPRDETSRGRNQANVKYHDYSTTVGRRREEIPNQQRTEVAESETKDARNHENLKFTKRAIVAQHFSKLVDSSPRPRKDETWYAVDGRFFDKLDLLATETVNESHNCNPLLRKSLETSDSLLTNTDLLPAIVNRKYVESRYLKPKVTKRTPLKPDTIDRLIFIHADLWKYLKTLCSYDHEIPRQVVPSDEDGGYQIEKQPTCIWLVLCETSDVEHHGLRGSAKPEYQLSNDELELVFKKASGEMNCEMSQIALYRADHLGNPEFPPMNSQDVGVWKLLPFSDKDKTLRELELTEAVIIHATPLPPTSFDKVDEKSSPFSVPPITNLSWLRHDSEVHEREDEATSSSSPKVGQIQLSSGGVVGLQNLGNTCFMNSALQCLSHTMPLTEFFLSGRFKKLLLCDENKYPMDSGQHIAPYLVTIHMVYDNIKENVYFFQDLNPSNPLGMHGRLAEEYYKFLCDVWKGRGSHCHSTVRSDRVVIPRGLKHVLSKFAPQFLGYQQQDSQELTAFLLDGLHEDLNRVLNKPYVETLEEDETKDNDILSHEAWERHQARNDSFIVDTFHGQYRGRLECPVCNKVSIVFDPFMYLTLPLPNIQKIPSLVTVLMPVAGVAFKGFQFGIVLSTEMNHRQIKSVISERIAEFVVDQLQPEVSKWKSRKSDCDPGSPQFRDIEATLETIIPVADFFDSILSVTSDEGTARAVSSISQHLVLLQRQFGELSRHQPQFQFLNDRSTSIFPTGYCVRPPLPELIAYLVEERLIVEMAENKSPLVPHSGSSSAQSSQNLSQLTPVTKINPDDATSSYSSQIPCHTSSPTTTEEGSASSALLSPSESQTSNIEPLAQNRSSEAPRLNIIADDDFLLMLVYITSAHAMETVLCASLHHMSKRRLSCRDLYRLVDNELGIDTSDQGTHETEMENNPQYPFSIDMKGRFYRTVQIPCSDEKLVECVGNFIYTAQSLEKALTLYVTVDDQSAANIKIIPWKGIDEAQRLHENPPPQQPVQLTQCLNEFLKEEQLGSDNMWYCNRCKDHRRAKKRIDIWKLPKVLVIHLKRFSQSSRHCRSKNNTEVLFERDKPLDMSSFLSSRRRRALSQSLGSSSSALAPDRSFSHHNLLHYHLFAVSNHMGGLGGGHYTATVKCRIENDDGEVEWQWMDFNDTYVTQAPQSDVPGSSAYLLFFQREDLVDRTYSINPPPVLTQADYPNKIPSL